MSATGLYYIDLKPFLSRTESIFSQIKRGKLKHPLTVKERLQEFTKRDQEAAKAARDFQITYNNISNKHLVKLIDSGQVMNLPVTRDHLVMADYIWGKNIHSIRGKTVTPKIKHITDPPKLPKRIAEYYCTILLCIGVMFVCGIKFLLTVLRHLNFVTVEYICDRKYSTYVDSIEAICIMYAR